MSDLFKDTYIFSKDRIPSSGLLLDRLTLIHTLAGSTPHTAFQTLFSYLKPLHLSVISYGATAWLSHHAVPRSRVVSLRLQHARTSSFLPDLSEDYPRLREVVVSIRGDGLEDWADLGGDLARAARHVQAAGSLPFSIVVVNNDAQGECELREERKEELEVLESRGILSWRRAGDEQGRTDWHCESVDRFVCCPFSLPSCER